MAKRIKPAVGWGMHDGERIWNQFGSPQTVKLMGYKPIRVAIVPLADAVRAGLVTAKEARAK